MDLINDTFLGTEWLWGVAAWRILAAFLLILLSLLAERIVRGIFSRWIRRASKGTSFEWDDDFAELVPKPTALVVKVALWYLAAAVLELPTEPTNVRIVVLQGLKIALWVCVIYLFFKLIDVLARAIDRAAGKTDTKLDDQLSPLVRKALKVLIAAVIVVMLVQNLGIQVTSLIASLGIGGLVLALAAKDTVANFFGSVVIFADQPFQVEDWIEVDDVQGIVEEVGFRTTRVRQFDKSLVIVPNHLFTSKSIKNHSARPRRRIKFEVGLSYDTTPDQMRAFVQSVRDMLDEQDGIDPETKISHFTDFGESSLNVMVYTFTQSPAWADFVRIKEEIMLKIMKLVDEQGLEIAFPTRTVHVVGAAPNEPAAPAGG
jgi:MscS family membrane protein